MKPRELQRTLAQRILSGFSPITYLSLDCSRHGLQVTAAQAGMLTDHDALMGVLIYIPGPASMTWARRTLANERVTVCLRPRDGHQYIRKLEHAAWHLKHGKTA